MASAEATPAGVASDHPSAPHPPTSGANNTTQTQVGQRPDQHSDKPQSDDIIQTASNSTDPDASPSDEAVDAQDEAEEGPKAPPPSLLQTIMTKTKLTPPTMITMLRGSLPPVIALALYQYPPFAASFSSIGYLVAIAATLAMAFQPRAQFLQTMVINIVGLCIGGAVALLSCFCAISARLNNPGSTSLSAPTVFTAVGGNQGAQALIAPYNSSAAAVAAIWLIFNITIANAARFSRPQLQTPVILYTIFANIAGVQAAQFPSMIVAENFVRQLLIAFLSGFAIATVVNLVVVPVSGRDVLFGLVKKEVANLKGTLMAEKEYLWKMEEAGFIGHADQDKKVGIESVKEVGDKQGGKKKAKAVKDEKGAKGVAEESNDVAAATAKLQGAVQALTAFHHKMSGNLTFAKREISYGKLYADDLDDIVKLLRLTMLPCLGLAAVSDIFERVAVGRGWKEPSPKEQGGNDEEQQDWEKKMARERDEWREFLEILHEPFGHMVEAMTCGLDHFLLVLELVKKPKQKASSKAKAAASTATTTANVNDQPDVEADAADTAPVPGSKDYGKHLRETLRTFAKHNRAAVRQWCDEKGLSDESLAISAEANMDLGHTPQLSTSERNRRHLYLLLHLSFLIRSTANAVLTLVDYADAKAASGQMDKRHFIFPTFERLRTWIGDSLSKGGDDNATDMDQAEDGGVGDFKAADLGKVFRKKRDPEHLPPKNAIERAGEMLRKVTAVFASPELGFGLRVALGVMTIAIVGFLENTQAFFQSQRLVWAQIMVALSMTMTSGSGVFGLLGRIAGTVFAAIISIVIWYIAGGDGTPGALFPVLWLVLMAEMYCFMTFPKFFVVFLFMMITQILILGYQLESNVLGINKLQSNGQVYYPVHELSGIRIAAVVAGCFVAFVFTYFPFPLTEMRTLRRRLGECILALAKYYSIIHTTISWRVQGINGDPNTPGTASHELATVRIKLIPKMLGMMDEIQMSLAFTRFEFTLGGQFPDKQYARILGIVRRLLQYMSLIEHATATYVHPDLISERHQKNQHQQQTKSAGKDQAASSTPSSTQTLTEHDPRNDITSGASTTKDATPTTNKLTTTATGTRLNTDYRDNDFETETANMYAWMEDMARIRDQLEHTTHEITMLLTLLASSLFNAQPLPPFLKPPGPYQLSQQIQSLDPEVLSVRHVTEPGYAAFAVTQVASRLISHDMGSLLAEIRTLVGEVDFEVLRGDAGPDDGDDSAKEAEKVAGTVSKGGAKREGKKEV